MSEKPDLSIIILSFNTKALVRECLRSIYGSMPKKYGIEILVCDNASTDGTADMVKKEFPEVVLIQNPKNLGFAAGNNTGIQVSRGRYILLLNSDTNVQADTLADMISFMDEHKKAGAATCKLILDDGKIDPACHRGLPTPWASFCYYMKLEALFPKTKLFAGYHLGYKDMERPHRVDCISGAFFLIRRDAMNQVGLLDDDYFMYGEDIDWAYRLKKAGWQVWYNPLVTTLHHKKQSGRSHTDRERRKIAQRYFIDNNKLFYRKHFEALYPAWVTFLVYRAFDLQVLKNKIF